MDTERSLETITRSLAQQNCLLSGLFQVLALRTSLEYPALAKDIIDLTREINKVIESIHNK